MAVLYRRHPEMPVTEVAWTGGRCLAATTVRWAVGKNGPSASSLGGPGSDPVTGISGRRVPWRRSERDDIDALTGQRVVPVLVIGREAICDSRRIVEHLAWRGVTGGQEAVDRRSGRAPT